MINFMQQIERETTVKRTEYPKAPTSKVSTHVNGCEHRLFPRNNAKRIGRQSWLL
jgi:hypothetical protein